MFLSIHVEKLDVSYNKLVGDIPPELGEMSSLGEFAAVSNELTGRLPEALTSSGSLHTINITDNSLSGTIPNSMGLMGSSIAQRQRKSIWFRNNNLRGTIPESIGSISDLTEIVLDGNDLTGTVPSSVCNMETGTTSQTFKLRLLATDCEKVDCRCSLACECSRRRRTSFARRMTIKKKST